MKEQQDRNRQKDTSNQKEADDSQLSSNASNEPTPIYLTPDSTLQTPGENRHDKSMDTGREDSQSVSNDDLHETNANRSAGSDRAGTAERKE
jgi:hypothetical protein